MKMLSYVVMKATEMLDKYRPPQQETALYDYPHRDAVPIFFPVPNTDVVMHQEMKLLFRRIETDIEPDV